MHDGEMSRRIDRLEWSKGGVKAEEPVQIDSGVRVAALRLRNRNLRSHGGITPVPERHHHRDSVRRPALEDRNDNWAIGTRSREALTQNGALKEGRRSGEARQCHP